MDPSTPLVFVTPNSWDADEAQRLLAGLTVEFSRLALDRGGATTLEAVATARARSAFAHLERPCVVENTELHLQGHPPLSGKAFKALHRELGDEGFCRRFGGCRARTRAVVALALDDTEVHLFTGQGEGVVVPSPRGAGGYGWDRVLQPDGYTRTLAELGPSRFLASMRQRAFLELAAFVRGAGTPGFFEAHITVAPCDVEAFAASCARLGVKCLHIVMPHGTAQHEQPMTGSYHQGTLAEAREVVLELARELVRDGFTVTRVKLEATGRAFGAPGSDEAARALPLDVYFEHHATVRLPPGFDEAVLVERCRALGGYVSRNLRKDPGHRFVTVRSYQVGQVTADARFARVVEELASLGLVPLDRAREFAVFDSAPQIDAGWMG